LAAATTRATEAVEAGPSGAAGKGVGRRSGIAIRSFSCAVECKLQTVKCLTLVGTEGRRFGRLRSTDLRDVIGAIQYIAAAGCQWSLLSRDSPPSRSRSGISTTDETTAFGAPSTI
jgi:hypothetical protein